MYVHIPPTYHCFPQCIRCDDSIAFTSVVKASMFVRASCEHSDDIARDHESSSISRHSPRRAHEGLGLNDTGIRGGGDPTALRVAVDHTIKSPGRSVAMVSAMLRSGPLTETYDPTRSYSMPAYWEGPSSLTAQPTLYATASSMSLRYPRADVEASTLSPERRVSPPRKVYQPSSATVHQGATNKDDRGTKSALDSMAPFTPQRAGDSVEYASHGGQEYDMPFYSEASLDSLLRSASRLNAYQQRNDLDGFVSVGTPASLRHAPASSSARQLNAATPYGNIAELHFLRQRVASLEYQLRYSRGERKLYDIDGEIMVRAGKVFSSGFYQRFLYERLLRNYFRKWLLFFRFVRQGFIQRGKQHGSPSRRVNYNHRDHTASPPPQSAHGPLSTSTENSAPPQFVNYADNTPAYVVHQSHPKLPTSQAALASERRGGQQGEEVPPSARGIRRGITEFYESGDHVPGGYLPNNPHQAASRDGEGGWNATGDQQLIDAATAQEIRVLNDVELMHSRLTQLEQEQDDHAHVVGVVFEHVVETGYRLEAVEDTIRRYKGDLKFVREQALKYEHEGKALARKQADVDEKLSELRMEMETTDEANTLMLHRREAELRNEWEAIASDRVEQERRRADAERQTDQLAQKLRAEQERFSLAEVLRIADAEVKARWEVRSTEQDSRNDLFMLLTTLKTLAKEREDRRRQEDAHAARRADDRRRELERIGMLLKQLERQESQERQVGILAEEGEARRVLKRYQLDEAKAIAEMSSYRDRTARERLQEEPRTDHRRRLQQVLSDVEAEESAARTKLRRAAVNGSLIIATEAAEEAAMLDPVFID